MEYDTAKDIVLDLLGWGVPPEYLVECGLSRELIYYVFTDLNLKLPPNLTGPFLDNNVFSPEFLAYGQEEFDAQSASPISGPVVDMQQPRLLAPLEISRGPASHSNPSIPDSTPAAQKLEDMERQRREELFARKNAVLASRKARRSIDAYPPAPQQSDIQVSMASLAPSETVESFLKSIEPGSQVGLFVLLYTRL
jgi:hypothetical protein